MDSIQEKHRADNLEFLRRRTSPATFRQLSDAGSGAPQLHAAPRPDGSWDLSWNDGEQHIGLHSRRDPEREAARQAEETLNGGSFNGCIVLGLAGMRHIKALAERLVPDTPLIILDPDPAMVAAALGSCDLHELDPYRLRITVIANPDPETVCREFRMLLKQLHRFNFAFFTHPSGPRIHPALYRRLTEEICAEIKLETTDRVTRAALAEEWLTNAIDGLPYTLKNPGIETLRNCFAGHTAIVAAAGPTLSQAIPMLRKISGQLPIFAVGTAVKPLLAADIVPDFIVALDSDTATLRQLPETGVEDSLLLAAFSVPPAMCARFPDRLFSYSFSGMKGFNRWLADGGMPPVLLNVGGTVALTAIDAARFTGCTAIILTGLDLAVGEDGTTHAKNSMYDGSRLAREQLITRRGNYGREVFTTPQFANYARQVNAFLADAVAESNVKFYNATTGGVFFDNTTVLRPEALGPEIAGERRFDHKREELRQLRQRSRPPAGSAAVRAYLTTSVAELRRLRETAAEAGQRCEALDCGLAEVNRNAMTQLDGLDRSMKDNPVRNMIEPALESMELSLNSGAAIATNRFAAGRRKYYAIAAAAEQAANKLEMALNRL